MNFKLITRILLLTALSLGATMDASAEGTRGGGDPDAVQFLAIARKMHSWLVSNHAKSFSISPVRLNEVIQSIEESLNSTEQGVRAKLEFTDNSVVDDHDVSKFAVFDRSGESILVDRRRWKDADPSSRYELVALELLGLAGSEVRYSEAIALSESIIESVTVADRQPVNKSFMDQMNRLWTISFDNLKIRNSEVIVAQTNSTPLFFRYFATDRMNGTVTFRAVKKTGVWIRGYLFCPVKLTYALTIDKADKVRMIEQNFYGNSCETIEQGFEVLQFRVTAQRSDSKTR